MTSFREAVDNLFERKGKYRFFVFPTESAASQFKSLSDVHFGCEVVEQNGKYAFWKSTGSKDQKVISELATSLEGHITWKQ